MRLDYLSSYDKSFKKLPKNRQLKAVQTIDILIDFFKTGRKPKGLGLKKLRNNYWEIRIDKGWRILFEFKSDLVTFIIAGDHDSIKKFLKG